MKVYPNSYYMTVHENIKDKNGEQSVYTRLFGCDGYFTCHIREYYGGISKKELQDEVEKILKRQLHNLEEFTVTETKYGWKYEMFVKWLNDGFDYEVVEEGQHTDHEVYTVDISYIDEVTDVFATLK
ncbi:hypothetical protein COE51_01495 [Bacillus pseudomycoides]|nr:hypothetical protein COE51_01495 [Bacillus pseudomycoides]